VFGPGASFSAQVILSQSMNTACSDPELVVCKKEMICFDLFCMFTNNKERREVNERMWKRIMEKKFTKRKHWE
jgi:hypothetical protein